MENSVKNVSAKLNLLEAYQNKEKERREKAEISLKEVDEKLDDITQISLGLGKFIDLMLDGPAWDCYIVVFMSSLAYFHIVVKHVICISRLFITIWSRRSGV